MAGDLQVGQAVVRAAALKGRTLRNPHAYGVLDAQAPGQRSFRLDVSLDFPQVSQIRTSPGRQLCCAHIPCRRG